MTHYTLEEWTDYARTLAPGVEYMHMRQHLEKCPECSKTVQLLESAAQLAALDRGFSPPAEVVAAAQSIFSPLPAEVFDALGSRLRRLAGILEWDSFRNAVPEGVRSLRPDSRHMVYRAGRYSIDLILDADPEADTIVVTGQLADDSAPAFIPGVVKTILISGRDVVASTKSTEWGEFSLQSGGNRNLTLLIPIEQSGECIELPVPWTDLASTEVNG